MNHHRLLFELDRVAQRFRILRLWQYLAAAWLGAALLGLLVLAIKFALQTPLSAAVPVICISAVVLTSIFAWLAMLTARDDRWVARQIEAAFPELHACLLTAVEQRPNLPSGRFGYLQTNVIHQALAHADRHEWRRVVPTASIATAAAGNAVALVLFLLVLGSIAFLKVSPSSASALLGTLRPSSSGSGFAVTVEPGDTEVERGTSLLVMAKVAGQMPPEATLIMKPMGGEESRLAMSAALKDPVFGGRIPLVDQPLDYQIELGGQTTKPYHVTVFEYPRLEKADARLVYPSYTSLEPRTINDVRTLSVVEGTELTLVCYLNKSVTSAILSEDKRDPIVLSAVSSEKPTYQTVIQCTETRRLKLELVDDAGRKNVKPATFTINVLPNKPVVLKPVFPAKDIEVSALEEIEVKGTAFDDYGIKRFGIAYSLSGQPPVEVILGQDATGKQKHELTHMISLESLKAEADDLLSYHFWAEDFGPGGELRRTESDMYFAEVRPFEEIFRQGEQPPGGQQQQNQNSNATQAQQIAELQKEIINATWKVIRREITSKLTPPFADDVEQIRLSQASAVEQATALAEKLQDPQSQEHGEAVLKAMQEAIHQLTAAHDQPAAEPLKPALKAEQTAYQSLLKLRAREHNIVRQSQRQQRGQASARSQQQRQQMQQLDLKNEENRYETQRQAQDAQESPEERENRQVLNRLKELAQRQHDLNDRLKELQSALEEARTQQQREELKRQLQRLQDEQRQVLQDTEELQSRMESPENMERMSAEREQLQQAREQAQRASEALENERVTQAAASGTRAEQTFEELRNEFRRRASGQFNDEMRQMREAARELDQREQDLNQRLNEAVQPQQKGASKSLRDTGEREKIAEDLAEQRRRLEGIQEQMRKTIEEAEETEPLLAERLYDAARNSQDQNVERALESAERSLRNGLTRDAQQQEQPAGRGIQKLREGIEQAAEAVLGDETEALRRAREELQRLSSELSDEVNRNSPNRSGQPGQSQQAQNQPGEPQPGEAQQQQPGQQPNGQEPSDQQKAAKGQKGQANGQKGQKGEKGGQGGKGQGDQAQPSEQQRGEGQQQEGQKSGKGKGGKQDEGGKAGQGQGAKGGQPQSGQQQPGKAQSGQPGQRQNGQRQTGGNLRGSGPFDDFRPTDMFGPLTGDRFRDWSDRLRDVEEMVADPELRAEAARIRERARSMRAEFKRHSNDPNWELVQSQVAGPLVELRDRVAAELLRRTAKQAIVPLDRDPVPPRYSEKTRLYYERLSSDERPREQSMIAPPVLLAEIILGGQQWLGWSIGVCLVGLAVLIWAYARAGHVVWVRVLAGLLKAAGIILLAALLLEPLFTGTRPRPGSNVFLVVADNSRSLQLTDRGHSQSRGEAMKSALSEQSSWLTRLSQDFDVRRYAFDIAPRPLKDFSEITLDGESSALKSMLASLGDRYRGQPIAGILLLTDGNATDLESDDYEWKQLPPVYPVAIGADSQLVDVSVSRVSVTQTNFEASPVTITAEVAGQGLANRKIAVRVLDEAGKELERRTITASADNAPLAQRFLIKPEQPGISFYTVHACLEGEEDAKDSRTAESTLANNKRLATVDRGGGPYRVLYVGGRANWEFKFLRRALDEDDELNLVGLVRIAKREPKFTFLSRSGERTNPLFRGFGNNADEAAEQYDQPVLIRLGTEDKEELLGGFPQDADALFRYHAIILDDVEAGFFKQDQLSLLQQFVSRRGGGLLMLGGKESFAEGGYNRTPVGEMLPVYLDRHLADGNIPDNFHLRLTREGLLQPWVRLRNNEQDETKRLAAMPAFRAMNRIDSIKPGASVLVEAEIDGGVVRPALVAQTFGRGRVGALLLTDLWRWSMQRKDQKDSDLEKAWRQTVRWLVSDVPQPVEVETRRAPDGAGIEIQVRARDKQFEPLDNAEVKLAVKSPDGKQIDLVAESSDKSPGSYQTTFSPRVAGAYRATVSVVAADGSTVGERPTGWSIEPDTEEFRTLSVNRPLLDRIAKDSGGEVIDLNSLDSFVSGLPNRKIPFTESWTYPLWHQWQVFLIALTCLIGEWGLRRWKGLP